MYQNEFNSRPSYEYVNPVYLDTLFKCLEFYSRYMRRLKATNSFDAGAKLNWHITLGGVFSFVRGHLTSDMKKEEGSVHKVMYDDMTGWAMGVKVLDDSVLAMYMFELVDYYYELGFTKVEVIKVNRNKHLVSDIPRE